MEEEGEEGLQRVSGEDRITHIERTERLIKKEKRRRDRREGGTRESFLAVTLFKVAGKPPFSLIFLFLLVSCK